MDHGAWQDVETLEFLGIRYTMLIHAVSRPVLVGFIMLYQLLVDGICVIVG